MNTPPIPPAGQPDDPHDLNTLTADGVASSWLRDALSGSTSDFPVPPVAPAALTKNGAGDDTGRGSARFSVGDPPPEPMLKPVHPQPTGTAPAASALHGPRSGSRIASKVLVKPKSIYGEEVPGYDVGEVLGRGGMGVVYKAIQVELNRTVALKMVLGGGKAKPQELARFLAEAALVASIKHPNVVTVYDYGEYNAKPFMALEFLPGGTLTDRISSGKMQPQEAASLLAKIARGVAAAHAEQIVHRDLKPQNVMFDAKGAPKVVDFGLARRAAGSGLTATEAVMGTPSYMSPEQAGGKTKFAGPPADVWSLGVMLYEMITGVRPFGSGSFHEVMARVLRGEFESPSVSARIPRDLEQICLKCMEPLPSDRYPTAAELADDLERFVAGETVTARPAGAAERAAKWVRRRPSVAAAYALGTVALGLTAFAATAGALWQKAEAERDIAAAAKAKAEEAAGVAEEARGDEQKARALADRARAEAESARDLLTVQKQHTEEALGREQVARGAEASARSAAETAANREKLANVKLTNLQYGRSVDLAHRAYLANDVARAARLLSETPAALRGWEWNYVSGLAKVGGVRLDPKAGPAAAVRVSSDGTLLTGHADGSVRLWDVKTGAPGKVLLGHSGQVYDAAFVPDPSGMASLAVTCAEDGTLKLWDINSGETVVTMTMPAPAGAAEKPKVLSLAVNNTGTAVVAGDNQGGVASWALPSGRFGTPKSLGLGPIQSVAFSPGGRLAAAGNGVLVGGGRGNIVLRSPAKVNAVAWKGETTLATGCDDGLVRVWDVDAERVVAFFPADPTRVSAVAYLDNGRLLTAGDDRTLGVWDVATGKRVNQIRGHGDAVWSAATFGRIAASTCFDGTVRLDNVDRAGGWESRRDVDSPVTQLAFGPDGRLLMAGRSGDLATLPPPPPETGALALSRPYQLPLTRRAAPGANAMLAVGGGKAGVAYTLPVDGGLSTWMTKSNEAIAARKAPLPAGSAAAFGAGPDYRLALATADGKLAFYTAPDGAPAWEVKLPKKAGAVAISPDGKRVAAGPAEDAKGPGSATLLFDAATGKEVARCDDGPAAVRSLAFSPDGAKLAAGGADFSVRLWDAATGRQLADLRGHGAKVEAVTWTPDGRRLASGGPDGVVKLWDAASGDELLALPAPDGDATSLAFSPDGRTLVAGGGKGEVRSFRASVPLRQPEKALECPGSEVRSPTLLTRSGVASASATRADGHPRPQGTAARAVEEPHEPPLAAQALVDHPARGDVRGREQGRNAAYNDGSAETAAGGAASDVPNG